MAEQNKLPQYAQNRFTEPVSDTLASITIADLYRVAHACGLHEDYGRTCKPTTPDQTLRGNLVMRLHESLRPRSGVPSDHVAPVLAKLAAGALGGEIPPRKREPAAPCPPAATAADIGAAVASAIQGLNLGRPDAELVRKLVREEVERVAPRVVELRCDNGETRTLEARCHAEFERVLRIISTRVAGRRLHAWLAGPSGSGKSHLAKQCAEASQLPYYSASAIQTVYALVGYKSPTGDASTLRTPFRCAFEGGGVFAFDDADASDARAFNGLNEALANGRFAFPDAMVEQYTDFVCIASANTYGLGATVDYVGRNKIDAATLTRFVRIEVGYDEELEVGLAGPHKSWARRVQSVRRAVDSLGVKLLVTPRHTLQGAALLTAGFPVEEVERMTLFAGMDGELTAKIRSAAR
jgi:cobaltochelatase CobS